MDRQQHPYRAIEPQILMKAVGGDPGAFRELSETFLRIAPPMFARLEQASAAADHAAAAMEGHSLKSTTALVGAAQLTRLVETMETFARRHDVHGATMALPLLAAEFVLVMQEVKISMECGRNASAAGQGT